MMDRKNNSPKPSFRDMLHAEASIQAELLSLQQAIDKSLRRLTLHGVREYSSPVHYAIVPFSAIAASGAFCLSAGYYVQNSQADAVTAVLARKKTATDFLGAIEAMLNDRCASVGRDSTLLNGETLRVLRSFYDKLAG